MDEENILQNVSARGTILELTRLLAAADGLKQETAAGETFKEWRLEAIQALVAGFGAADRRTAAFSEIEFNAAGSLLEDAERRSPKVVHGGRPMALPIDEAREHHFQQKLTEAVALLRSALTTLETQSSN